MKTFVALKQQASAGCDYTIGCGKNWEFIQAETIEEAAHKLSMKILDNLGGEEELVEYTTPYKQDADYALKRVMLIEVSNQVTLLAQDLEHPIEKLRLELRKSIEEKKRKDETAAEKREYARLKKKYG